MLADVLNDLTALTVIHRVWADMFQYAAEAMDQTMGFIIYTQDVSDSSIEAMQLYPALIEARKRGCGMTDMEMATIAQTQRKLKQNNKAAALDSSKIDDDADGI